jgi:hypothetical protein
MRDRETDSWWSIMSSSAIGGSLDGTQLSELPVGEKVTWADWSRRHPESLVLSVRGEEHIDTNPYDNYFDSKDTFRGLRIDDQRLEPKQPIFSFWVDGKPFAAPFSSFEGGRLFRLDDGRSILLARPVGSPIFQSTKGYLLGYEVDPAMAAAEFLGRLEEFGKAVVPLEGFDTYWYTWVSVNPGTELLE